MFVNNLRIFWPSKILLITLNQVQLKSVCDKFHVDRTKSQGGVWKTRFSSDCNFAKKQNKTKKLSRQNALQSNPAPLSESGDFWLCDVWCGSYRQKRIGRGHSAPLAGVKYIVYNYNRVPSTAGPRKHSPRRPRGRPTTRWRCHLAGLGTPWDPPGGARRSVWGEGSLSVPDKWKKNGWMDNQLKYFK